MHHEDTRITRKRASGDTHNAVTPSPGPTMSTLHDFIHLPPSSPPQIHTTNTHHFARFSASDTQTAPKHIPYKNYVLFHERIRHPCVCAFCVRSRLLVRFRPVRPISIPLVPRPAPKRVPYRKYVPLHEDLPVTNSGERYTPYMNKLSTLCEQVIHPI